MRIGHQIDRVPLLILKRWKQAGVKRLLWHKGIAKVKFPWHDINVHGFTDLINERLEALHDLRNVRIHLLIQFTCSIASSQHIIYFLRLHHRVSRYNQSLNLAGQHLTFAVGKLTSQKSYE